MQIAHEEQAIRADRAKLIQGIKEMERFIPGVRNGEVSENVFVNLNRTLDLLETTPIGDAE